jgi:superfamily I DNA and/or RNA helicase
MDEAAQMMEAEALIPLSMASTLTTIIMAGDDKQLGPVFQVILFFPLFSFFLCRYFVEINSSN